VEVAVVEAPLREEEEESLNLLGEM